MNVLALDAERTFRPCHLSTSPGPVTAYEHMIEKGEIRKRLSVNAIETIDHSPMRRGNAEVQVTDCLGERLQIPYRFTRQARGVGMAGGWLAMNVGSLAIVAKDANL